MQQERMDSGPAHVRDHATGQIEAFRRHIGSAVSAAREQNGAAALAALHRAANAFTGLVRYLYNRTGGRRPNLQTVNQPLMAARSKLKARSWSEALAQLNQMLTAGLTIIRALADQIAGDDTTPDVSPRGPTNGAATAPPSQRDRRLRSWRHRR